MEYALNLGMLRLLKPLAILLATSLCGSVYDFDLIKKGKEDNNTLLVVGGIQGDEPGGFLSASLLATHYKITKGSLWIVPNLNFYSIIQRSRGPYGDMNRKFAYLDEKDPEYANIQRIKHYIQADTVKLIVNLHDGSGFYRPYFEDKCRAPNRWGQCSIIDQQALPMQEYGDLETIANSVVEYVNKSLLRPKDRYHLHNTHTKEGNKEMEKTLTYYAINQGKAAFGNEASKSLPAHERVYYHLLALERYMQIMGIEYSRKFELSPLGIYNVINNDISVSFYNGSITLPLGNIKKELHYFPITKDQELAFRASNPLMKLLETQNGYVLHYGNRELVRLKTDKFAHNPTNTKVKIEVDKELKDIAFGSLLEVKEYFMIKPSKEFRINVIGFQTHQKDECDVKIKKENIPSCFSIDTKGKVYRVEYYKENTFAGMILVKFV